MFRIVVPKEYCFAVYVMHKWAVENSEDLVRNSVETMKAKNKTGRLELVGFAFYFKNEEDAAAFKLRWL